MPLRNPPPRKVGYAARRRFIPVVLSGADEHSDTFEHVVLIYTVTRAIIDCFKSHTLMMEWSALRQYVDHATFCDGINVRRFHRQEVGKKCPQRRRKRNELPIILRRRSDDALSPIT